MRSIIKINDEWEFIKENKSEIVNLPHTWNGIDGQDGGNDYYRGCCVYKKKLKKSELPPGEVFYLQIDGANSSATVYFNQSKLTTHHGGYSTFRVKLDDIRDENELKIEVDNSPNDFVYPQLADFTFYGGIYRDVKIIGVSEKHFDLDYYGAPGIMVTPVCNGDDYEVMLSAFCDGQVEFAVYDGDEAIGTATAFGKNPEASVLIKNAHLWNGISDPYLYTAAARLIQNGDVIDEVSCRFGCRSFEVDSQKGFILNGREYPLRGVSRHQDRPQIGNALKYEHHKEDIDLICEMGANTVRLAHYQHAQEFYDLCDERGLVVWAEIPYISKHLEKGAENTRQQMTELICQNYNHPSIVTWGLSNEITMNGSAGASMVENHKMLNDLAHSLDKTRPTTLAVVTLCGIGEEYVHISDIVSYNHYFGWYGGNVSMYGPWFDKFHSKYPDRAIGISEYGCEALDWHSSEPEQGDYTEEYQAYYHEELIKQISQRPYLWATHVWNMFDFAADARAEGGENGMNHKGLVTFDRKYKKDSFYAYKAWLSSEPVLHICGKRYVERVEELTKITIYSNQSEVELFADGKSIAKQTKGEYPFFYFEVRNDGDTVITAKAGELSDEIRIKKVDTFNEKYIMKEAGGVINWFEIDTPVGYFSVNDTLGSIIETLRGKLFLLKLGKVLLTTLLSDKSRKTTDKKQPLGDKKPKSKSKGISVMGFNLDRTLLELGKGFSIKRIFVMLGGGKFTKEQIIDINKSLNKIKKPIKKDK